MNGYTKRWYMTFKFCESEAQARIVCENSMKGLSAYVRKRYAAHYTPWNSKTEPGLFIAWIPDYRVI